jgi:hypothetical protein
MWLLATSLTFYFATFILGLERRVSQDLKTTSCS